MPTCPKKRKPSDLAATNGQQSLSKQPNWGSVAGLAKRQGCSQRTMREWCKKGLIEEAYQTRGGQWRIHKPLSMKTCLFLEKRRKDYPFKGKTVIKTLKDWMWAFEPERAEMHALARLFECEIREDIPVPYTWEWVDYTNGLPKPRNEKEEVARKIQREIKRHSRNGESLSGVILISDVYQWIRKFSPEDRYSPRVTQLASFVGISRQAFYRLYPNPRRKIEEAYSVLYGEPSKRELPDPSGLDPVLKQNINAKKRTG
jgi:hypothetical protein